MNFRVRKVLQPFSPVTLRGTRKNWSWGTLFVLQSCISSRYLPLYTTLFSLPLATHDRVYIHLHASCKTALAYSLLSTESLGFSVSDVFRDCTNYLRRVKNHARIIHSPGNLQPYNRECSVHWFLNMVEMHIPGYNLVSSFELSHHDIGWRNIIYQTKCSPSIIVLSNLALFSVVSCTWPPNHWCCLALSQVTKTAFGLQQRIPTGKFQWEVSARLPPQQHLLAAPSHPQNMGLLQLSALTPPKLWISLSFSH
jgi:hypothetical protein